MSKLTSHESAHELLPWYVNGTLEHAERKLVEAHVQDCLTCHLELEKERELRELVKATHAVDVSAEAGFHRLSRRLDNGAYPCNHSFKRALADWWKNSAITSRLALATCSLAAVGALIWGTMPLLVTPLESEYLALTGTARVENQVDIIFADDVTETEIRALLSEINGSIVAGPTQIGRYTVRLEDTTLYHEGLTALIRVMSADDRVRFAGPAILGEPDE